VAPGRRLDALSRTAFGYRSRSAAGGCVKKSPFLSAAVFVHQSPDDPSKRRAHRDAPIAPVSAGRARVSARYRVGRIGVAALGTRDRRGGRRGDSFSLGLGSRTARSGRDGNRPATLRGSPWRTS
jgi:hypothetical protein